MLMGSADQYPLLVGIGSLLGISLVGPVVFLAGFSLLVGAVHLIHQDKISLVSLLHHTMDIERLGWFP